MWPLIVLQLGLAAANQSATAAKLIEAKCDFSVHKDGPNGEPVAGTDLNAQLYYRIKCLPEREYCLEVANCSVSSDGPSQKPYAIIDEQGCSLEPSLFEHVVYEDDFTAGIYNPVPIRFRGSNAAVLFNCVTALRPRLGAKKCEHRQCATWSEFSSPQPTSRASDHLKKSEKEKEKYKEPTRPPQTKEKVKKQKKAE